MVKRFAVWSSLVICHDSRFKFGKNAAPGSGGRVSKHFNVFCIRSCNATFALLAENRGHLGGGRLNHLDAGDLRGITGYLGLHGLVDEVIIGGDFVAGGHQTVTLGFVASVGIGAILGFHGGPEGHQVVRHVGNMGGGGTPRDKAEEGRGT